MLKKLFKGGVIEHLVAIREHLCPNWGATEAAVDQASCSVPASAGGMFAIRTRLRRGDRRDPCYDFSVGSASGGVVSNQRGAKHVRNKFRG